jgi:uncharacterized alpha-E superfamily protein
MARYLERAANLVRLVSASQNYALLPEAIDQHLPWQMTVAIALDQPESPADADAAVKFLVLDRDHPSSLFNCIRQARDNARTARHLLPDAYWEAVNTTWMEMREIDSDALEQRGLAEILDWAAARLAWIRGCTEDILRGEVPHVMDAGTALERVDYLARLVARCLPDLGPDTAKPGSVDHHRWKLLMSAGGTLEAYRRVVDQTGDVRASLDMLIFSPDVPRSLVHQLDRMAYAVRGFCGVEDPATAADAEALSVACVALKDEPIAGLSAALLRLVADGNALSEHLQNEHFTLPLMQTQVQIASV